MTGVARRWIPLRESIGEDALRQSIKAFILDDRLPDQDIGFIDSVPAHVADIYQRLKAHEHVGRLLAQLRRRGVAEFELEILLRRAALAPDNWRSVENEPQPQTQRRRARLAKQLRDCAESVASDLEMSGFWLMAGSMGFSKHPIDPSDWDGCVNVASEGVAFSDLLQLAASFAEAADDAELLSSIGVSVSRPARSVTLRSFVLREMFDLLAPYFKRRAPNREAEILASVVLQTEIPHGTMTRMRAGERRRYCRDKQ